MIRIQLTDNLMIGVINEGLYCLIPFLFYFQLLCLKIRYSLIRLRKNIIFQWGRYDFIILLFRAIHNAIHHFLYLFLRIRNSGSFLWNGFILRFRRFRVPHTLLLLYPLFYHGGCPFQYALLQ